jgi:hypothetical protein
MALCLLIFAREETRLIQSNSRNPAEHPAGSAATVTGRVAASLSNAPSAVMPAGYAITYEIYGPDLQDEVPEPDITNVNNTYSKKEADIFCALHYIRDVSSTSP